MDVPAASEAGLLVVAPLEGPQAEVRAVEVQRLAVAQVVMLAVRSQAERSAAVMQVVRSRAELSAAVMRVDP